MEQPILLTLQIIDKNNHIVKEISSYNEVELVYNTAYQKGDKIKLTALEKKHYVINFDKTINSAVVYLKENTLEFRVPFGEERLAYPPAAFAGSVQVITVRAAKTAEIETYRNLSVNSLDKRGVTSYYPHCTANVETRDESVFAARNTIDGMIENTCHGEWPYQSWGDNEDPNAEIMLEFGRFVKADKVVIYLRADFPHDNYWKQVTLLFSDNSELTVFLDKTREGQPITFGAKIISWVKLIRLTKDETDPSPFPALTQWEVYGTEV